MSDLPDDPRLKLATVSKENGVADLPLKVRGKFAKAIIAERLGNHDAAEQFLNEAVYEETAYNTR